MISSLRTLAPHLRNAEATCVGISPVKPLPAASCVQTDNCPFRGEEGGDEEELSGLQNLPPLASAGALVNH